MAGCGICDGYMSLSFLLINSCKFLFQFSDCLQQRWVCVAKEDEFLKQNHSAEAMIIYEGGCLPRVGRSRKVPLNARKVESITVRCPVQRTKIKATKKECFTACGEESTYQGTYTGVTFRPLSEMPLINSSEKAKLLGSTVVQGSRSISQIQAAAPDLPDDWLERNGKDVPLFWNESKPIAFWCALIDDWKIQAVFDLTPGSGACMEACLMRGVQYYGVCHGLSLSIDV